MGDGDAWPRIRAQLIGADILIISTPTWMGQPSSVCQRVLERLDAELAETGDDGQLAVSGKVAIAAVVGNEDGAHHISGIVFQCRNDVGFTIPAQGVTYWNGEAMHSTDFKDLDKTSSSRPPGVRAAGPPGRKQQHGPGFGAPASGSRAVRQLGTGPAAHQKEGAVSEFDKLKDDGEQYAKDHPEQVKEGEGAVEKKLGVGQQDQSQSDDAQKGAQKGAQDTAHDGS
jgi:multimeric flavodoxin WrbA